MGKSLNVPMDVVHDVMLILDYHSTPGEPSGTMMRRAGAIHSKLRDLMDATPGVTGGRGWVMPSIAELRRRVDESSTQDSPE